MSERSFPRLSQFLSTISPPHVFSPSFFNTTSFVFFNNSGENIILIIYEFTMNMKNETNIKVVFFLTGLDSHKKFTVRKSEKIIK